MKKIATTLCAFTAALLLMTHTASADDRLAALIVDGRNNHDWQATTPLLRKILENSGRFSVDVATAGEDVSTFRPAFSDYDVVVLNYNGEAWPEPTREDFVRYVAEGGGVTVVHAANNAFADWDAYNRIIGLGGWGDRDEGHGPYVYFNDEGELIRDSSPGRGGSHGRRHEFAIDVREPDHPIMRGLPQRWLHTEDELYDRLRGPAENLTVLASGWADPDTNGSGRHEPLLMTITYGEGRVFHTTLGHAVPALEGLGFQVTLQRGAEWAATGEVTITAPGSAELPAEGEPARRDPAEIPPAPRIAGSGDDDRPHIVFVTGDEEYRSEETMPMFGRILKNRYGFRVTVCYALTDGIIDPNRTDNIEGLEALEDADMMVVKTRFRQLPAEQLRYIVDFAESGRPMAGFRVATHAFRYGEDHPKHHMDDDWPTQVFGQKWIRHYGGGNSTDVKLVDDHADHVVLNGVEPFHARSWLYVVDPLHGDVTPLLYGRAVEGTEPGGDHFGDPHSVAWVKHYEGEHGTSRVFFTTLGHPFDFFNESLRTLTLNGFFWALGMEDQIPDDGLDASYIGEYDPNDAGFGDVYKPNMRPADIPLKIED